LLNKIMISWNSLIISKISTLRKWLDVFSYLWLNILPRIMIKSMISWKKLLFRRWFCFWWNVNDGIDVRNWRHWNTKENEWKEDDRVKKAKLLN
jgi:hypothetical protein